MDYQGLEDAYQRYKTQPDAGHELFTACLAIAKQQLSIHTWGNDLDRDDLAQEVTLAAWLALPTIKPHQIFSWWFLGIIRNKVNDALRRKYRVPEESLDDRDVCSADDLRMQQRERIVSVANTPLTSLLLSGHTLPEASQELGISESAARRQIQNLQKESRKS